MQRSTNPEVVNGILNHEDVRPYMMLGDPSTSFDFTQVIMNPFEDDYYVFDNGEDVVAIFQRVAPGVVCQHTAALQSASGMKVVRAFKEAHHLLEEMGIFMVWGATPVANVRAQRFNKAIGGTELGERWDDDLGQTVEYVKFLKPTQSDK